MLLLNRVLIKDFSLLQASYHREPIDYKIMSNSLYDSTKQPEKLPLIKNSQIGLSLKMLLNAVVKKPTMHMLRGTLL
jgi:hypothetical protein